MSLPKKAKKRMNDVFLTREEIEHPYANLAVMLEDKRRKAEQMSKTVFSCITQSEETLAEKLVYAVHYDGLYFWHSTLIYPSFPFETREEAIAATVAKLKEVEE